MPLKRKRRKKKKFPNRKNSAKHFKEWATVGREVIVNGKDIRVYSRGKLVEAFATFGVPKTYTTIMNWENAGILPKSPIVISGKSYYTKGMIETIVLTYIECGNGKNLSSPEYYKQRLWDEFNRVVEKELF